MEIKFTKKTNGHHLLTVIRTNGTVARGHVVPGFGAVALPMTSFMPWSKNISVSNAECTD